jgi:hypothetical protein
LGEYYHPAAMVILIYAGIESYDLLGGYWLSPRHVSERGLNGLSKRRLAMKKERVAEKEKPAKTRSSITVASETVCEDEACIGKIVNHASPSVQEPAKAPDKRTKPSGSMSFGGKQGCSDEACIGKS